MSINRAIKITSQFYFVAQEPSDMLEWNIPKYTPIEKVHYKTPQEIEQEKITTSTKLIETMSTELLKKMF